jgi:dihydroorotate dehydrogenase
MLHCVRMFEPPGGFPLCCAGGWVRSFCMRAMSALYRHLVRPLLFTQDAEQIHNRTMRALGWTSRHPIACEAVDFFFGTPAAPTEVFGLKFRNPVGLAAGMDKHAAALPVWPALGFGFTELGAITWHSQPGNPEPRIFRIIADEAIINRMGFNNPGAEQVAKKLAHWQATGRWPAHPVGINLGKSKITPLEKAAEDYAQSFRILRPYADFFVVNVSSPNTPNLRQLQDRNALDQILAAIQEMQTSTSQVQSADQGKVPDPKPILVKVAPDLSLQALDEILELVGPRQIAGIIATNTTVTRPGIITDSKVQPIYAQPGGLSGRPLRNRSTEIVRHLYRQSGGTLPIIGVGGVFTAADAWEKIAAGACLIQIYTSLVYEGPGVVKAIVAGLVAELHKRGLSHLSEAVGIEMRS